MGIQVVQKQREEDPLDKLANAVNVAKSIYGIYVDTKTLEQARAEKAKQKELQDLQINKLKREEEASAAGDVPETPLVQAARERLKPQGINLPTGMTENKLKGMGILDDTFKLPPPKNALDDEYKRAQINDLKTKAKDPFKHLNDADKKIAVDTAAKLSDTLAIKDEVDGTLAVLNDPNIPPDQKLVKALGALKVVNSASLAAPDVVGKEEAVRAGAYLTPATGNLLPGRAGPGPFSKPDVAGFTEQMRILSESIGSKAGKFKTRVESITGTPMKAEISGSQPKAPAKPPPGSIINVKGERYQVGADGETLTALSKSTAAK